MYIAGGVPVAGPGAVTAGANHGDETARLFSPMPSKVGNRDNYSPLFACEDRLDAFVELGWQEWLLQKMDRTGRHALARYRLRGKSGGG